MDLPPLKRDIDALTSIPFDLCVVGGGITGLCIAHDAAARGLKVALVERGDFAEGTSSASTKLIHGGTRYLEHYEFGLVREALRERRILLRLAPHLINPIPFMIPIYEGGPVPGWLIRVGMFFYDALSYDKNWGVRSDKRMGWHRFVSPQEALELEPAIEASGLKGASIYYDGQVPNPMRLCLEVAKTAAGHGAQLANYARVEALKIEHGRVHGVEVEDRKTGRHVAIEAAVTVNAAGIWATDVMRLTGAPPPVRLKPSKGVHLVTRALSRTHAVVNVFPTGRRIMIIPWRGKSLVGTTDVFYEGNRDRIRTTVEEAQQLLNEVNAFLPGARLSMGDVEHAYAGARPLIEERGKSASDLSRDWRIVDHGLESGVHGCLSVVGGKLTTSRSLAKTVVDRAAAMLGRAADCPTAHMAIGGGDIGLLEEAAARLKPGARGLVDDACLLELVRSYGAACGDVLDYVQKDPRLGGRIVPDKPFILAEIPHAVEREMASTVSDIALRRTDVGNLGDRALVAGRIIADELARLLSLSPEEKQRQLADYADALAIEGLPGPRA